MSFRNIKIEKCYETSCEKSDLLNKFYIPLLENSTEYYRIAGFFSSTSLTIAAKGIEGLINNGGKMKLLISPELTESDYLVIKNLQFFDENSTLFQNLDLNEFLYNDNLKALAWLLANNKLEIKIVINKNSRFSLFHQKVGIAIDDDDNIVSFSGSINETAQAWLNNIEEFKTFCSWIPEQLEYLKDDLRKFREYWNNERDNIAIVYDLPESIKRKIIQVKPNDINELEIMRKYVKKHIPNDDKLNLFPHQIEAVNKWLQNDKRLLLEMATGTGKTRTAIGCIEKIKDKEKKLVVIVSTPQNTLSRQWKKEIEDLKINFEASKIIDGTNRNWKIDLECIFLDINSGYLNNAILFTTHDTSSSKYFLDIVTKNKGKSKILFICDEVHAIGSSIQQRAMLSIYEYRVGLSATPERMFDDVGTNLINDYFGNNKFKFTIFDALNNINPLTGKPFLNRFYYYPRFVELTPNELNRYIEFSKKIAILENSKENMKEDITKLLNKRADIIKDAEDKFREFEKIIDEISKVNRVENTIVFVTPKQMNKCLNILTDKLITRSKVTENESAKKKIYGSDQTERENIISQFKNGDIQVILGIKCLDEGIDIPNARVAIILASSRDPREYVQRVGRVIRQNPNKKPSVIYDVIVKPSINTPQEFNIFKKEAIRVKHIAKNAVNFDEIRSIFLKNGVDLDVY